MESKSAQPDQDRLILLGWMFAIVCVIVGSLLPASSPAIRALDRLGISDKAMHFSAYLLLSCLPVVALRDRRRGLTAGLAMLLLGILLEGGQHFSPGRTVDLGDVLANGAGIACGLVCGVPMRALHRRSSRWISGK